MARQTLSDRTLKALKPAPAGKRYELFDAIVPSMGVRVTDKIADQKTGRGNATFFLLGRFPPSTNPTRRALGEYPALELAKARDKAREWLALLEKGIDPKQQVEDEKRAREREQAGKSERAFETVLERYIKARRRDGIRKVDEDERDFNRECLPKWKGRAVGDITNTDIMAVLESISERGAQRQALNMAQKIGTFFSWCVDDEVIEVSPYRAKKVRTAIGEKASRERVLTDAELRAFWKATQSLGPVYREVYRLLLLTGQRLNDIAQAATDEINDDKKVLTIPAARFKSNRDHAVPLPDEAVALIENLPKWKACKWLCSLDGEHSVTIGHKVKQRLDKAMLEALRETEADATLGPWVNHDLRRTVRTRLSELDVMDEVAEAVIGHVPTALVRTYNQSDRLKVKRDALARWEGALKVIVGDKQADSNVIPMQGRA